MDRALSRRVVLAGATASLALRAGLVPGDTGGAAPATTTADTTTGTESDIAADLFPVHFAEELRSNFSRGPVTLGVSDDLVIDT